ncbi:hypothetical protein M408DRAFT_22509 [Serendipita vermifera MAFF 305830]|uniref:F-box domain-containing protein n=1 Tax=Serendipita vermifera MAFF 305830 TaxID=933852 RepID=A0A0C3B027_SERVB|nr:hypothetical protein M408DRAFT_22509 [Serendipita vermifera MAFF 305830]
MVLNLTSYEDLNSCLVALGSFSSLRTLSMFNRGIKLQGDPPDLPPSNTFPRLVDLTYYQPYSITVGHLIHSVAHTLVRLRFDITVSDTEEIINLLGIITNLEELCLFIRPVPEPRTTEFVTRRTQIPSLQRLELQMRRFKGYIPSDGRHSLLRLFAALAILYPSVIHVSISGIPFKMPYVLSYIQTLSRIDSLSCEDDFDGLPYTCDITLPTLTMLSTDNPDILRHTKTPNLLRLNLWSVTSPLQLEGLYLRCLVRLSIRLSGNEPLTYSLDPSEYPALIELSVNVGWTPHVWVQTSLILLRKVTITSFLSPDPHGNILCVSLLYNPELLPSLQQVFLSDFVEWDLLFLMLKQRNFGLKGVQKIRSFTVPFIPIRISPAFGLSPRRATKPRRF